MKHEGESLYSVICWVSCERLKMSDEIENVENEPEETSEPVLITEDNEKKQIKELESAG